MASARSLAGLDWLNFSVANAQTGFGAFVAVYLTTEAWTQAEIGEALSLGTIAAMLAQIPGGAAVDRLRDKRVAAAIAALALAASALLFAAAPTKAAVMLAEVLHSLASCLLAPALAAISLALVGRDGLGERLGRNARFAAFGNGIAAVVMGLCGAYLSGRAVFWITAAALPLRALLLATTDDPTLLVSVQALDGVSAAVLGVMLPLVAADLTLGTGRFNLCLGVLGLAAAGGATLSTLVAGLLADRFGTTAAFLALGSCGLMAVLAALTAATLGNAK